MATWATAAPCATKPPVAVADDGDGPGDRAADDHPPGPRAARRGELGLSGPDLGARLQRGRPCRLPILPGGDPRLEQPSSRRNAARAASRLSRAAWAEARSAAPSGLLIVAIGAPAPTRVPIATWTVSTTPSKRRGDGRLGIGGEGHPAGQDQLAAAASPDRRDLHARRRGDIGSKRDKARSRRLALLMLFVLRMLLAFGMLFGSRRVAPDGGAGQEAAARRDQPDQSERQRCSSCPCRSSLCLRPLERRERPRTVAPSVDQRSAGSVERRLRVEHVQQRKFAGRVAEPRDAHRLASPARVPAPCEGRHPGVGGRSKVLASCASRAASSRACVARASAASSSDRAAAIAPRLRSRIGSGNEMPPTKATSSVSAKPLTPSPRGDVRNAHRLLDIDARGRNLPFRLGDPDAEKLRSLPADGAPAKSEGGPSASRLLLRERDQRRQRAAGVRSSSDRLLLGGPGFGQHRFRAKLAKRRIAPGLDERCAPFGPAPPLAPRHRGRRSQSLLGGNQLGEGEPNIARNVGTGALQRARRAWTISARASRRRALRLPPRSKRWPTASVSSVPERPL